MNIRQPCQWPLCGQENVRECEDVYFSTSSKPLRDTLYFTTEDKNADAENFAWIRTFSSRNSPIHCRYQIIFWKYFRALGYCGDRKANKRGNRLLASATNTPAWRDGSVNSESRQPRHNLVAAGEKTISRCSPVKDDLRPDIICRKSLISSASSLLLPWEIQN